MRTNSFEVVPCVQRVVAQEFERAPVKTIRSRLSGCIQNGAGCAAKLSIEIAGLDLEFLQRVDRREVNVEGAIQVVGKIRVVVYPIEEIVILIRWGSIGGESAIRR